MIDTGTPYLSAAILEKSRLYIQLPEAPRLSFFEDPSARMRPPAAKKAPKRWTDHPRLAPIAALKKRKKFSVPKLEVARTPDLYFRASAGAQSAAGALLADPKGFDLHVLWALGAREQVVMGELSSSKVRARALLDDGPLKPAVSIRARLMAAGARQILELLEVPFALSQGLDGGLHVVVTSSGELVVEIAAGGELGEPARALLEKTLQEHVAGAKVVFETEAKRLGVYVGATDAAGLRKLGDEEPAPVVIDIRPERLLSVLGGIRDRYGPRLRLNNVELMAARMVLEPVVRATESMHFELSPHGAAVHPRADVRYRE